MCCDSFYNTLFVLPVVICFNADIVYLGNYCLIRQKWELFQETFAEKEGNKCILLINRLFLRFFNVDDLILTSNYSFDSFINNYIILELVT
jgi:hypothetical protein